MASPTVSASSSGDEGSSSTSHTLTYPAGVSSGLLVVWEINCANSTNTVSWPAGTTQLSNLTTRGLAAGPNCGAGGNAADSCHSQAYRIADGSEGASITVTTSGSTRCCYVGRLISGAHASSAPEITVNPLVGATNGSPDPPSITPSWGTADNLYVAAFASIGTGDTVSTYPSGYTTSQFNKTGTSAASMGSATQGITSSTTENPGTYSISPNQVWTAYTIAVRPAAAAATASSNMVGCGVGARFIA